MISDKKATDELTAPDFFALDKKKDLTSWCMHLKTLLEPEKKREPADVNRCTNLGPTVLHNAVAWISQFKQEYGAHAQRSLCTYLLGKEGVERVMADKKARGLVSENFKGVDISYGELVVEYLCCQGANVNALGATGKTPIFYADTPEIVYILRRNGTDLRIRGRQVSKHLRSRGGDAHITRTAVYDHIKKRNLRVAEALLEYIPGQNNLDDCFFSQSGDGQRFYREGEYTVYLTGDPDKPHISKIQRLSSARRGSGFRKEDRSWS